MSSGGRDEKATRGREKRSLGLGGFHRHPHAHEGEPEHVHPHHHHGEERPGERAHLQAHTHAHPGGLEGMSAVVSPVHALDPRAKLLAALVLVLTVVLSPPPRPVELAALAALLAAVALTARLRLLPLLARSALVLPFAGAVALFAPITASGGSLSAGGIAGAYSGGGWMIAYSILAKAWLSASLAILVAATTPAPRLFKGLERLRMPDVMLTLLSFSYRYSATMAEQVRSMRAALDSRGFGLGRAEKVRLYGHLAGNMLVRAYERGERVHAAMLSRGYDGSLPSAEVLEMHAPDWLVLVTAAAAAGAIALY